jgi:ssDNA-binding Zn-finger/Zn-ribbon topoisomerase 1
MGADRSSMRLGGPATVADILDRVLDKGVVINADIAVSLAGVELLAIKIRAVLASLEAAAKYGLQLPAGSNLDTEAWKQAVVVKEDCPQCGKRSAKAELLAEGCPWCGWVSAKAQKLVAAT